MNFSLVEELYYGATIVTTINSYSKFYSTFVEEIISPDGKYVQLYRKMNNLQVQRVDWSKLLNWNGAMFRFNKIVDFDSEITESTKIEMIKVIEARNKNRKFTLPSVTNSSLYTKIIINPQNGVGAGEKVLSGGAGNQVLALNKVIRG
jgi:hypothetical protein